MMYVILKVLIQLHVLALKDVYLKTKNVHCGILIIISYVIKLKKQMNKFAN